MKRNSKISSATLLETMIALTIIVIVFGIGLLVMNNVLRTENMHEQLKGNILIGKYFNNVKDTLGPDLYHDQGFDVERAFYPYSKDNRLTVMVVKVYDPNKKLITEQKEIMFLIPKDK